MDSAAPTAAETPTPDARRRRRTVPTAVLVAMAALVALLGFGVLQQQNKGDAASKLDGQVLEDKRPAAPAQQLARPLLDGSGQRRFADLAGGITVVNFWASWCDPCREEAPALQRVHHKLEASGDGTVLGVTYHDNTTASRTFVKDFGLSYPSVRDPGDDLFEAFGNLGIPETFVLDARGRIVAVARGAVDERFLDNAIRRARQPQS